MNNRKYAGFAEIINGIVRNLQTAKIALYLRDLYVWRANYPPKDSTLRDIILYVLEARGEIADTDIALRKAASMLADGKIAPWPAITLNFLLGKRPNTTQKETKQAGWEGNLRKAFQSALHSIQDLL